MKKIICIAFILFTSNAFSADLKIYMSKEVGEVEYRIILGSSVGGFGYNEDEKTFHVYLTSGQPVPVKLDDHKLAKEIIKKMMDDKDKSLIEISI